MTLTNMGGIRINIYSVVIFPIWMEKVSFVIQSIMWIFVSIGTRRIVVAKHNNTDVPRNIW